MYYCELAENNWVVVRTETGRLVRKININQNRGRVIGAQVSGDMVSIQLDTGRTDVYNVEGRLIRNG